MDEVIVETETLINYEEMEVETPNAFEIEDTSVNPSMEGTMTISDEVVNNEALAPDAIFSDSESAQSLPETGSENIENVEQVENTTSEQSTEQTSNYNIDDLYTLLSNGEVSVKLQNESETEILQSESESESELTISDILNKLDENILIESEAYQAINDNIVNSNNNENIFGFIIVSILASILGGLVAIGFLKGLR